MVDPPRRASARLRTHAAILTRLQRDDRPTQADLVRELGYAPSTVSAAVGELVAEGRLELVERSERSRRAGRPGTGLRLRLSGVLLGIEFDHDRVHVSAADAGGEVLADDVVPVDTTLAATHVIHIAARLARDILRRLRCPLVEVRAAGIGLPGPVDVRTGIVGSSSVLPHWQRVNVADEFRRQLGRIRVHVDNDANLAAQAEALHTPSFVYIKASTGLGAALCIDGVLIRGVHGAAGELGHVAVPGEARACRCGARGCLETVSASAALVRRLAEAEPDVVDMATARALRETRTALVDDALFDMGAQLGAQLAHVCTMLDVDRAIIGGELAEMGAAYIDGARETARARVHPQLAPQLDVGRSALGHHAGRVGALVAARRLASRLADV
jgi:predicted NBD/HSP70 family sugar kinase